MINTRHNVIDHHHFLIEARLTYSRKDWKVQINKATRHEMSDITVLPLGVLNIDK